MYYRLTSKIKLGLYTFSGATQIVISRSAFNLTATAILTMPLSAILQNNEKKNISRLVGRGESVSIELGYNDVNEVVFDGYISEVQTSDVITIRCEDKSYLLRKKVANRIYANTSVEDILFEVAQQCDVSIKLASDIPDVNIPSFRIYNATGLQVLQILKNEYGLNIFFNEKNELWAGLLYGYKANNVTIDMQRDVVQNNTTFKEEDEIRLKVEAKSLLSNNTQIKTTVGDTDGELRTLFVAGITSELALKRWAENEMKRYKYTGLSGSFTAFFRPKTGIGDSVSITDNVYQERNGTYYCNSVEYSWGANGARQTIELGIKLTS